MKKANWYYRRSCKSLNDLPIKGSAELGYVVKEERKITDTKVFPPRTHKIEKVGRLIQRTFLVRCDGNGKINFTNLRTTEERFEELKNLRDKGYISKFEYEQRKREILDQI